MSRVLRCSRPQYSQRHAVAAGIATLYERQILWTGPRTDVEDSGDTLPDEFVKGCAEGPIGNAGARPVTGVADLVIWLKRTGDGDQHALKFVYDATSAKLFGVILRILSDRHEAEEILQEVYVTVWRKAAEFDPARTSPLTWLVAIARNRAIDRARSLGSRPATGREEAAEIHDLSLGADRHIEASEEARRIEAALLRLDPRHASIIRSAYVEGLTYDALSLREGVPAETLKSWVWRGLQRLKTELRS